MNLFFLSSFCRFSHDHFRKFRALFSEVLLNFHLNPSTGPEEVGLVALSAATRAPARVDLLLLPLAFAAGMTLVDTANGILMAYAYAWAGEDPAQKP